MYLPEMWMMIWRSWCQMTMAHLMMTNNLTSETSASAVKITRKWFWFCHNLRHVPHDGLELRGALVLALLHQGDPVLELAGIAARHCT